MKKTILTLLAASLVALNAYSDNELRLAITSTAEVERAPEYVTFTVDVHSVCGSSKDTKAENQTNVDAIYASLNQLMVENQIKSSANDYVRVSAPSIKSYSETDWIDNRHVVVACAGTFQYRRTITFRTTATGTTLDSVNEGFLNRISTFNQQIQTTGLRTNITSSEAQGGACAETLVQMDYDARKKAIAAIKYSLSFYATQENFSVHDIELVGINQVPDLEEDHSFKRYEAMAAPVAGIEHDAATPVTFAPITRSATETRYFRGPAVRQR